MEPIHITETGNDIIKRIKNHLAFSSKDYGRTLEDQFLYGIVFGWTPECYKEFGMNGADAEVINKLHNLFVKLSTKSGKLDLFDLEKMPDQAVWVQPKGDPLNGKWGVVEGASENAGVLYLWEDPFPYAIGKEHEAFITRQMKGA